MKPMFKMIPTLLALCALAVVAPACDKGDKSEPTPAKTDEAPKKEQPEAKKEQPEAKKEQPAAKKEQPAAKKEQPAAAAEADYIKFVIDHHNKSKGLVNGSFGKFKVVKANIDLSKPDTAMAVVEIDISSIATGNPKRDKDIQGPSFFDTAKFPKMTVTVDNVKAGEAGAYTANASVDMHGIKKALPVSFKVAKTNDDGSIVIEGEHKGLSRLDWGVGGSPETSGPAANFDVSLRLTLANK